MPSKRTGFDQRNAVLTRVEDMAAVYLAEIRKIQPSGPYHLVGYSFGGVVAYEMVRQLKSSGEQVGVIGLIDTFGTPLSRRRDGRFETRRTVAVRLQRPSAQVDLRTSPNGRVRRQAALPSGSSGLRSVCQVWPSTAAQCRQFRRPQLLRAKSILPSAIRGFNSSVPVHRTGPLQRA